MDGDGQEAEREYGCEEGGRETNKIMEQMKEIAERDRDEIRCRAKKEGEGVELSSSKLEGLQGLLHAICSFEDSRQKQSIFV